jgi:hypothetical protein
MTKQELLEIIQAERERQPSASADEIIKSLNHIFANPEVREVVAKEFISTYMSGGVVS